MDGGANKVLANVVLQLPCSLPPPQLYLHLALANQEGISLSQYYCIQLRHEVVFGTSASYIKKSKIRSLWTTLPMANSKE